MNKIYLNKRPTTSSLLPPYKPIVDRYDFYKLLKQENIFDTVDIKEIETFGLDEIIESKNIVKPDFLKIDV